MEWTEHAERSLFRLNLDPECWPHELAPAPLAQAEPMARLNCKGCRGSVWVSHWPAQHQGVTFEDLVRYTEGLVNSG
jgi:hypothetical protein